MYRGRILSTVKYCKHVLWTHPENSLQISVPRYTYLPPQSRCQKRQRTFFLRKCKEKRVDTDVLNFPDHVKCKILKNVPWTYYDKCKILENILSVHELRGISCAKYWRSYRGRIMPKVKYWKHVLWAYYVKSKILKTRTIAVLCQVRNIEKT